jgi:hypothetical protein
MTKVVAMRSTRFLLAGMAALTVLIAAECVRAGVGHYDDDTTGNVTTATDLVAAELDPIFMQKLAYRMRAAYMRAHGLAAPSL